MYDVYVSYDYSAPEKSHYFSKPPSFSGGSTQFEWWKRKMYTYIISLDDELWDMLEYGIDLDVNGVRIAKDRKTLTPSQKKVYRKHHRVQGILIGLYLTHNT